MGFDLWDLDLRRHVAEVRAGTVGSLFFRPRGDLVTVGHTGIHLWPIDLRGDEASQILTIGPPRVLSEEPFFHAALERSGRFLAATRGGEVAVVDLESGRKQTLGEHQGASDIAISRGARWVATGPFGIDAIKVWERTSGKQVGEFPAERASVRFSEDATLLYSTNRLTEEHHAWSTRDWQPVALRESIGGGVVDATSADGEFLAVRTSLTEWSLVATDSGEILVSVEALVPGAVRAAALSPDDSLFVVANKEHQLEVWDLRAIREELAAMGLDWDLPLYPTREPRSGAGPLEVNVDLGELKRNRQEGGSEKR